ncbi:EAL domain-containing protein [uncultured Paraglaciecola sp.]|uniref:bifunctional diguanylate cyclase/phosphodiesterase n=1 Tax=uncultured Paraglaciecola sp. TaxID=1765024 RepID=UPI002621D366|nr:EAL domain-containing protein [uncultured Paraglaciecola sp.]
MTIVATKPANELQRLQALCSLNILNTEPEERFDRLTRLTQHVFNVPYVFVSLIDEDRQWFKSKTNFTGSETPRDISFCAHTILEDKVMVIEDATQSAIFIENPLVTGDLNIRFYAGAPLIIEGDCAIGTLCILDTKPRKVTKQELNALQDLAKIVVSELTTEEINQKSLQLIESQQELQQKTQQLKENESLHRVRNQILELIVQSKPLNPILHKIVRSVEQEYPGMLCSILLLDDTKQHLTLGAAPSLPDFYNEAIEGIEVGEGVGSCGTAAFSGKRVVAEDLATHPYWVNYKELTTKANLGSCWSEPIINSEGSVIGTFGIYHQKATIPNKNDLLRIEQFAYLASISIERQSTNELIWQQANFDDLTGLPNRNMMAEHVKMAINTANRNHSKVAIAFLDLDNFKDINDSLGHSVGDDLLISCGERIKSSIRSYDTVARLGGDEFVVVINDITDLHGIDRLVQGMLKTLTEPYKLQNEVVHCSASIGITIYPNDAQDIDDLLKNADQAMYSAKNLGRNNFQYYTQSMRDEATKRLQLISDLRQAIDKEELFLVYQPIVDLHTGVIHKAEALLRWEHPVRGLVGPLDFIPLAEETGMIIDISNWVFHQVISKVKSWRNNYCPNLQISINTSPSHYTDTENSITQWLNWLLESKTPPQAILLEITEHLLMDSHESVSNKLFQFCQAGVEIALDDFGTGYSSISYLKKYPTNYLKMDKSFVQSIHDNGNDLMLCEAIITMAKKLNIKVIAEGIETKEQQKILQKLGCEYGQGYLFARPLPILEFEALLKGQHDGN